MAGFATEDVEADPSVPCPRPRARVSSTIFSMRNQAAPSQSGQRTPETMAIRLSIPGAEANSAPMVVTSTRSAAADPAR